MLRMLTRPHRPPDETSTLPTHFHPHHSLRFPTPALTILTLAEYPPDMLPTPLILTLHAPETAYHPYARGVPSQHAPNTTYPYACVVPSQHALNTAYHPYARGVHSRHAPNTTYPYACCPPNTACHPYACVVPSRHAPNTAYHPYAHVVPSRHCLPSLRLRGALPTCSQHHLSLRFRTTSIVYGGLLAYTMNAIAEIC
ncbi:hypothetical protein O181_088364 [Austropuccinia psidii MF-1]|uniref:Uncharacterized protein n=1 Tax=Austropuccinia psidii MF-1 TaxID=1389203 RepID=A0A9Q3IRJ8_9BASI|nr:hypothetical protein [Austropuccinia psidii MF-1]